MSELEHGPLPSVSPVAVFGTAAAVLIPLWSVLAVIGLFFPHWPVFVICVLCCVLALLAVVAFFDGLAAALWELGMERHRIRGDMLSMGGQKAEALVAGHEANLHPKTKAAAKRREMERHTKTLDKIEKE